MLENVRWGMIGCGRVTEQKSAPGLFKVKNSSLIAVMNRNEETAQSYAARYHVPKVYAESDSLINDTDIEAVYIATPPSSHKDYTLAAARAGKAVYVEKPMGLDHQECLEMIAACDEADVPLFVAYYRRALPRFLKIKTLLENEEIGAVRCVSMTLAQRPSELDIKGEYQWRNDPKISGCGKFCEKYCHMLDLLHFYFGPISSAYGYAANQADLYEVPDMVSSNFMFESGIHVVGTWNFASYENVDLTEIVGSRGRLSFSTFLDTPILLDKCGKVEKIYIQNPEHVQQPLIQTIVDELTGKGKCPSTGLTAAETNLLMDKILRDSNQRRANE